MKAGRITLWAAAAALLALCVFQMSLVGGSVTTYIAWAGPSNPPAVQADMNGDYDFVLRTTVGSWPFVPVDLYIANTPGNNSNIAEATLTFDVHLGVMIGEYATIVEGSLLDSDEDGVNELSAWEGTYYGASGAFQKTILH